MSSYFQIFHSTDLKIPCKAAFLDFRKAFNTIPHPELLFKLWSNGITGPLWKWFQSSHSHYVHVDGSLSSSLPVKPGVPQDNVLGPILLYYMLITFPLLFPSVHLICLLTTQSLWKLSVNILEPAPFNKTWTHFTLGALSGSLLWTALRVQLWNSPSLPCLPSILILLMINLSNLLRNTKNYELWLKVISHGLNT